MSFAKWINRLIVLPSSRNLAKDFVWYTPHDTKVSTAIFGARTPVLVLLVYLLINILIYIFLN